MSPRLRLRFPKSSFDGIYRRHLAHSKTIMRHILWLSCVGLRMLQVWALFKVQSIKCMRVEWHKKCSAPEGGARHDIPSSDRHMLEREASHGVCKIAAPLWSFRFGSPPEGVGPGVRPGLHIHVEPRGRNVGACAAMWHGVVKWSHTCPSAHTLPGMPSAVFALRHSYSSKRKAKTLYLRKSLRAS
jgi:hypothetical protein